MVEGLAVASNISWVRLTDEVRTSFTYSFLHSYFSLVCSFSVSGSLFPVCSFMNKRCKKEMLAFWPQCWWVGEREFCSVRFLQRVSLTHLYSNSYSAVRASVQTMCIGNVPHFSTTVTIGSVLHFIAWFSRWCCYFFSVMMCFALVSVESVCFSIYKSKPVQHTSFCFSVGYSCFTVNSVVNCSLWIIT